MSLTTEMPRKSYHNNFECSSGPQSQTFIGGGMPGIRRLDRRVLSLQHIYIDCYDERNQNVLKRKEELFCALLYPIS